MTKLEFLAAFRQACDAMPTELVEAAIANYERQFTDLLLSGLAEETIVGQWGTPQRAALKLKLGTLNGNLKHVVSVEKVARVGISGAGLALLDFFLLIPATIYFSVLAVFYAVALVVYLTGIFVSASSLAGVNYIDIPTHSVLKEFAMKGTTHINLGSVDIEPAGLGIETDHVQPGVDQNRSDIEVSQSENLLPERGLHIATHLNQSSIWKGISTTLAGMLLLLLCLLTTRFTFRVLRQFVVWHFTVLKNA